MLDSLHAFLQKRPASAGGAYSIARSLRFNAADTAYLNRTFGTATSTQKATHSFWVKRGLLGGTYQMFNSARSFVTSISFNSSDQISILTGDGSATGSFTWTTTQVFRDPSAWYHILVAWDTTQGTATNRLKLWVNGAQVTAFGTQNTITQNMGLGLQSGQVNISHSSSPFDGYMAEIHHVDGTALDPTSFGETNATTGQWVPKQVTGVTYGANGFWLSFYDNTSTTTLGRDDAGGVAGSAAGSNDWTLNNLSATAGQGNDSSLDTPSNNFCVMNPLKTNNTHSNGNLDIVVSTASANTTFGTFGMSSGKWYWETVFAAGSTPMIGICTEAVAPNTYFWTSALGWAYYTDGTKYTNNAGTSYGNTYTTGDIIGVAFDADNGKLWFSKNGTWQASGDPAAGTNAAFTGLTSGPYFPAVSDGSGSTSATVVHNFGHRALSYTPPTGFVTLCTQNLPTPSIVKPSAQFNVKLYTGNSSTQSLTGVGHQPDLLWVKNRAAASHIIIDSVRGVTKELSVDTAAESTQSRFASLDSDGWSFNSNSATTLNLSGNSYVAWSWKKGVTPGLDIVTWTGTGSAMTVAHNLGVAPKFMVQKFLNTTSAWSVYHASVGNTRRLTLNTTDAQSAADAGYWNNTSPTSSVFSVGATLAQVYNMVTYCFAEVAGFSKFGSYTGNGSADGPFVHCGFQPRFVLLKRTDTTSSWVIIDTARQGYNIILPELYPDQTAAEVSTGRLDALSSGFKLRQTGPGVNASGGTYIFAAFAEFPFKYANAR